MKKTKTKLSLEAFKAKAPSKGENKGDLSKVLGGIMGACHCVVSTYTFYNSTGVVAATYTVCVN